MALSILSDFHIKKIYANLKWWVKYSGETKTVLKVYTMKKRL